MLAGFCTVTNTADSGFGSLRAAIDCSNFSAEVQTIDFNIPGAGTHTIQPDNPLPTLFDPVVIDGSTQPGFSGMPVIEFDGINAGPNADGLHITNGSSLIRGIAVNRFGGNGIFLDGGGNSVVEESHIGVALNGTGDRGNGAAGVRIEDSVDNIIGGPFGDGNVIAANGGEGVLILGSAAVRNVVNANLIGTDANGDAALGNQIGISIVAAPGNSIGGVTADSGNLISGNLNAGVQISGSSATANAVNGNTIGTTITGNAPLPNKMGIFISGAPNNSVGSTQADARNLISGNQDAGIWIQETAATGNAIQGNYIGTNMDGTASVENGAGILISSGATETIIGGTAGGAGNLVSGNAEDGVHIIGVGTSSNAIIGNLIGTNADGSADLGNGGNGIRIASPGNIVGGTEIGEGNVLSGNDDNGIVISGDQNVILGNLVGVDQTGSTPLGNANRGIYIIGGSNNIIGGQRSNFVSGNGLEGIGIAQTTATGNSVLGNFIGGVAIGLGNQDGILIDSAPGNTIGGPFPGNPNQISGNTRNGIRVLGNSAIDNQIKQNSIFNNQQIGIDLNGDGATPNDGDDTDNAANLTQNSPDIHSATLDGLNNLTIVYSVSSTFSSSAFPLTIEFYGADSDGEEGQSFLGSDTYNNAGVGKTITIDSVSGVSVSDQLVATATDRNGNTSEFSGNHTIPFLALDLGDAADPSYPTLNVNDGAVHNITARFFLGGTVDAEDDGQPTPTADGDDLDGNNDDDGVVVGGPLFPGSQRPFTVTVTDTANVGGSLDGWVDWNGDGTWTHPDEQIFASQAVNDGTNVFQVQVPAGAQGGLVAARFRLSSTGGLIPSGPASDGEVEDYLLHVPDRIFTVDSIADTPDANPGDGICDDGSGACTLRAAIEETNALSNTAAEPDVITFNLPGAGPQTIQPASPLPNLSNPVVLDATTQTGYDGSPLIELDGSNAGDVVSGLKVTGGGSGSTIRGFAINRFDEHGIFISRKSDVTVRDNYLGTDLTGTQDLGNGEAGVYIINAVNNLVHQNLISGNDLGIFIEGPRSTGNLITGNMIGTNAAGTAALKNRFVNIEIAAGPENQIGGTADGDGNLISGSKNGVSIRGATASGNLLLGNKIGTNAAGTAAIRNTRGVKILDSDQNILGGAGFAGNLISGNTIGLLIQRGENNLVQGNHIGTDADGTAALPNTRGLLIRDGFANQIGDEPNVISGNLREGIKIFGSSTDNVVRDNLIGTNAAGDAAIPNDMGIRISGNASGNTIGGTDSATSNVISGNTDEGLLLRADNNTIIGNFIGTDASGTTALSNDVGVLIYNASGIHVGGANNGEGNVISGNDDAGIRITGNNAADNSIEGNLIGTNAFGNAAIGNKQGIKIESVNNTIGSGMPGAGNVISGNNITGIVLRTGASGTTIEGNRIGISAAGNDSVGNRVGILIEDTANNTVGGIANGAGNSIAGNVQQGIKITGASASGNQIRGNAIGFDRDTGTVAANLDGVRVTEGASDNTIGGTEPGSENEIANNTRTGIWIGGGTGNAVLHNSIHDNGQLGLTIDTRLENANDTDDADVGANNIQNFPEFTSVTLINGNLTVAYSVPTTISNSAFPLSVEFYAADNDAQEGETFLGSHSYTATGSTTTTIPAGPAANGTRIVATATDAEGNTSEFSTAATVASPLLAAGGENRQASNIGRQRLTTSQLLFAVDAAVSRLGKAGFDTALFPGITWAIADLPGQTLGLATPKTVTIDVDAAGYGWYIDTTPRDDAEFASSTRDSRTVSKMDLLTVVMHELGHVAGLDDLYGEDERDDLMYAWLDPDMRKAATSAAFADEVFAEL